MTRLLANSTAVLFLVVTAVEAQQPGTSPATGGGLTFIPAPYDIRYGYHSSTIQEGISRGVADQVRSLGEYNRLSSEAAINFAEARRNALDTYARWVDTFYNVRQKIRDYRWAERRPRPSKEDLVRYAEAARPDRLNSAELDEATGDLSWPMLLRGEAFARYRAELERVLKRRAANREMTTEDYLKVDQLVDRMRSELKQRVRQVPLQEYAVAKRFLRSVAYEAQLPIGPLQGIAGEIDAR